MNIQTIRNTDVPTQVYKSPVCIKVYANRNEFVIERLVSLFEHHDDNLYRERAIWEWLFSLEHLEKRCEVENGIAHFLLERDFLELYLTFFEPSFLADWFERRVSRELDWYPKVQDFYLGIQHRNSLPIFKALVEKFDCLDDSIKVKILKGHSKEKTHQLIYQVLHCPDISPKVCSYIWTCFSLEWIGAEGTTLRQAMIEIGFDWRVLGLLRLDVLWKNTPLMYARYIKYPYSVWALRACHPEFFTENNSWPKVLSARNDALAADLQLAIKILTNFSNAPQPPFTMPSNFVLDVSIVSLINVLVETQSKETLAGEFASRVYAGTILDAPLDGNNDCLSTEGLVDSPTVLL